MIPTEWLEEAANRIAPHIRKTPLHYDSENNLYLKLENRQITGSFKVRGALNKVLALQDWERERGLVAASAGNHGQGIAFAGGLVGAPVVVFASEHAVPAKLEAMRRLGAEVRLVPGGYGEAEQAGLAFAAERDLTWISPYNDGQVIAGQGTLALEILNEKPELQNAVWITPVGGGGLIAGIGAALHVARKKGAKGTALAEKAALIGVQSEASPFFYDIFHKGSQAGTLELPSLADGLAGPVEENSVTIPLARTYVRDLVLVSEDQIAAAIGTAWRKYSEYIEGSAAAALAAAFSGQVQARPAVVILSGGNIQPDVHAGLLGPSPS